MKQSLYTTAPQPECALLIGIASADDQTASPAMAELARLAQTAGCDVFATLVQPRQKPDPKTFLGKGKIAEAAQLVTANELDLIIADDELTPGQIAAIEAAAGCKVIDRTTLILDIFARHASTREGKLQVELAQQRYRLSHLKGLGQVLSRTGGGIGTRGPGEKKLETDRRHIHRQIDRLQRQLDQLAQTSAIRAQRRRRSGVRAVSLVGYTNAGKSTLFNRLTSAAVHTRDAPFVTLDTTTRRINPEYGHCLLSDTVGFIDKLPHELIRAFRATLAAAADADLLLHVVDASDPRAAENIAVVERVLEEIGAIHLPRLLVYNKIDRLPPDIRAAVMARCSRADTFAISAKTGEGLGPLAAAMIETLSAQDRIRSYLLPYRDGKRLEQLYRHAEILSREDRPEGIRLTVKIGSTFPDTAYRPFLIASDHSDDLEAMHDPL